MEFGLGLSLVGLVRGGLVRERLVRVWFAACMLIKHSEDHAVLGLRLGEVMVAFRWVRLVLGQSLGWFRLVTGVSVG